MVVVPIWKKDDDKAGVLGAASSVKEALQTAGIKVKVDGTEQKTPGWKYNFWEMKVHPYSQINLKSRLLFFWLLLNL